MNGEQLDWTEWTERWQRVDTPPEVVPALARRVQTRSRQLTAWIAIEMTIAAIGLVVLVFVAATSTLVVDRVAMTALAVVVAATAAFAVWNWRGVRHPHEASQQAFLDLSLLRCSRIRRGVAAGWWLLAAEVACFVPWIGVRLTTLGASPDAYLRSYGVLTILTAAAAAFLIALRRWAAREKVAIQTLAGEIREDDGAAGQITFL
jgi:hypothetical protein